MRAHAHYGEIDFFRHGRGRRCAFRFRYRVVPSLIGVLRSSVCKSAAFQAKSGACPRAEGFPGFPGLCAGCQMSAWESLDDQVLSDSGGASAASEFGAAGRGGVQLASPSDESSAPSEPPEPDELPPLLGRKRLRSSAEVGPPLSLLEQRPLKPQFNAEAEASE
eukprot:10587768-Alexandrium_andersonii.AAC.1